MNADSGAQPVSSVLSVDPPRFRWTPFDTAAGTVAMGVLLTIVLVLALRLLSG